MSRFHLHRGALPGLRLGLGALAVLLALAGCSRDAVSPKVSGALGKRDGADAAASVVDMSATTPPAGLATIGFGGENLSLWPYTGVGFDGVPRNPVNLVFVGKADPVQIRAALLALPEDHSGSPIPDFYPFNSRWSDAVGSVGTGYADGEGWVGDVIELQLGRYEYGRVHLRLYRTGKAFGSNGVWTLGTAEYEILIPNTADHEVLSWEWGKRAVIRDMLRTGLLDATAPMLETQVMSGQPTFRNIREPIYAGLPMELKYFIYGANPPAGGSPGIPTNGRAMILNVATAATVTPGTTTDAFTLTYNQVSEKPFCSTGPLDYVLLQGPVSISQTTTVDASGALQFSAALSGRLAVTPIDITANPPMPSGETFYANVSEIRSGATSGGDAWVTEQLKRVGNAGSGAQMYMTRLRVGTSGEDQYRLETRCLGPEAEATARTP